MQNYPQEIIDQAFTPSTENHHKHTWIFIVLATLVLCVGAGIFFFLQGDEQPAIIKTTTSTGIRLTTTTLQDYTYKANDIALAYKDEDQQKLSKRYRVQLCYAVNEEKEPYCFLNPYGDFLAGETVYVYFRPLINSVEQDGTYTVAFVQDRKVYDPFGNEVVQFRTTAITYEQEVPAEGTYGIGSYNSIATTKDMALGEYYMELDIRHTLTGKRETLIVPFYLT